MYYSYFLDLEQLTFRTILGKDYNNFIHLIFLRSDFFEHPPESIHLLTRPRILHDLPHFRLHARLGVGVEVTCCQESVHVTGSVGIDPIITLSHILQ